MNSGERACVASSLEKDPSASGGQGDQGAQQPDKVGALVVRCRSVIPLTEQLTIELQVKAGGALSQTQLGCVREGLSKYSIGDLQRMAGSGVLDMSNAAVGGRVGELLLICGVNLSGLVPGGTIPPPPPAPQGP